MKILDKFVIIIFNLCLVIVAIWISAIPISKSKSYYQNQFRRNEIYAQTLDNGAVVQKTFWYVAGNYYHETHFTDEELDLMIDHIIDFLFHDKESFALTINDMEIFGETAVSHMADVRDLFILWQIISVVALLLMIGLFAYICLRINQLKKDLLTFTLIFYGIVVLCFLIFFIITYFTLKQEVAKGYANMSFEYYGDTAFRNLHYLFFPFQPDKVQKSFFNDTLTEILTIELFGRAIFIVILVLTILQTLWLTCTIIIRKYGDRIANKIKQYRYNDTNFKKA